MAKRTLDGEIDRLVDEKYALREVLIKCEAYFDGRADAEYFPDSASPVPNEEMRLLTAIREVLAKSEFTKLNGEMLALSE